MGPTTRVAWFLVLACVALALFVGLAAAMEEHDDLGLYLCRHDDPSWPAVERLRALPLSAACRNLGAPAAQTPEVAPGLLSAAPGGLCLLI